jgi:1-acyl-sn-glycerol-3-phosphate acyltransferase
MSQLERRVRSRILGLPFVATNASTRFEIVGREHLLAALERRRERGTGLVTISNHQSLFDDPLVVSALLGLADFTVETKTWWSTPCRTNFSPDGRGARDRFVRWFSDVSNMVFFSRREKSGRIAVPERYVEALRAEGHDELLERVRVHAARRDYDAETWLRRFVTPGRSRAMASLNQLGMIEACARVELGDWLHFFPEATRSRELALGAPKRGVGKVIHHAPDAAIVPIAFCGMQAVLPIGATVPRPFQRVVVHVGEPVCAAELARLVPGAPGAERFQDLVEAAWAHVEALWPGVLGQYLGREVEPGGARAAQRPARADDVSARRSPRPERVDPPATPA